MPHDGNERAPQRIARLVAVVAGIAGLLLCSVIPLLPVRQTTATILWPQGTAADGHVTGITAPLVSGAPRALDISIPCAASATLPADGGLVLSTLPSDGFQTGKSGLFVRPTKTRSSSRSGTRWQRSRRGPRWPPACAACCTSGPPTPGWRGLRRYSRCRRHTGTREKTSGRRHLHRAENRSAARLSARIDVDTRFITAATAIKKAAMALAVLMVLAAMAALAVLDRHAGRRVPRSWRRVRAGLATWLADAAVIATLLVWHLIGATSTDDGYNLTIARVSHQAGYLANYYRFFGASEAPFDWYPAVLAHLASVSTAGVWMRLPATAAGIGCWLIISRYVLPRLGPGRAAWPATGWPCGPRARSFWPPGCPSTTDCAGAADRLRHRAHLGAGRAGRCHSAAGSGRGRDRGRDAHRDLGPQGLIALGALLTGSRAIAGIIARRRHFDGLLAPLAVLAASLSLVLVVVFRPRHLRPSRSRRASNTWSDRPSPGIRSFCGTTSSQSSRTSTPR
ncbi:mycobacterial cell wall arabinan synthesis family protein [Mycobacterium xenopi 3993]|nr:mycobacterial cell wall arabinan synthesis family protein [Mycobacterium xenopi 3993]